MSHSILILGTNPPHLKGFGLLALATTIVSVGCSDGTAGTQQDSNVHVGGVDNDERAGGANIDLSVGGAENTSLGGARNTNVGGSTPRALGGAPSLYHVVSGGERSTVHEFGFEVRATRTHVMDCAYNRDSSNLMRRDVPERDWLCTFKHGASSGHVYVQATPVKCNLMLGVLTPDYETHGWIEIDGVVSELADAAYSWGEVHHVDSVSFALNGFKYVYRHSTMMFGRPCQPMDCLSVSSLDNKVVENGCTEARTLPVTCVSILEDGTHPDLTDRFKLCDQETLCTSTGGTVARTRCEFGAWKDTCRNSLENCELDPNGEDQPYCQCPTGTCFDPLEYTPYEWNGCIPAP